MTDSINGGAAPQHSAPPPRLQWAFSALAVVVLVIVIDAAANNDGFGWGTVSAYLFHPKIIAGVWTTLYLSAIVMVVSLVLGTLLAVSRLYGNRLLSSLAAGFVWFFRSVPVLVQLVFWYNAGSIVRDLTWTIPFTGYSVNVATNDLISPLSAAVLGLGLAHAAFTSEYIRGSLLGVQHGQILAGQALGMTTGTVLRRVVLPQAVPIAIPALSSEFVTILKATSLVSVIGLADVLSAAQIISAVNFQIIPLLLVASAWYLVLVSIFEALRYALERYARRWENR